MKLRFTPQALAELDDVLGNIAIHSPQGAKRVQVRLKATFNLLLEYPQSGVATDEKPMRRIVVRPYPYVIFYEHSVEDVVIIAIRHGVRDPSTMPGRS